MRNFFRRIFDFFRRQEQEEQERDEPLVFRGSLTQNGILAAAEYYNQKYPERGKITPVFLDFKPNMPSAVRHIKKNIREYPAKIIVTRNGIKGTPLHSNPFVLTRDKMILMRGDKCDLIFQEELAKALGLELIEPRGTDESFQADATSCHLLALGILKDLTKKDLKLVSKFEDGYTPMAKSLKYCQSRGYLNEVLNEQTRNEPVKKDGRAVYRYLVDNRIEQTYPLRPETRIQVKEARLIGAFASSPSQSPRAAAEYALKKFAKEKSDKSSGASK